MRIKTAVMVTAAAAFLTACTGSTAPADGTKADAKVREERIAAIETDEEKGGSLGEEMPNALGPEDRELSCLSMDKVLELADKDGLSWADLEGYQSEDAGFGLMIQVYDIDKHFFLAAGGAGFDQEPMYIRLVSADDEDYIDIRQESSDKVKEFLEKHRFKSECVGIKAHVKELQGDRALLSSDTDDFPGVFWVLGVLELAGEEELQGGTPVFVMMEDMGQEAEDGIAIYKARQLYGASEQGEGREDILLTKPPALGLSDPLSSTCSSFQVLPGNYSWNTAAGEGVIACGSGPLDEAAMQSAAKLKLPRYNGPDKVSYSCFFTVWPDKLVVRQWDVSCIGNGEAEEERQAACYCRMPFMELERGKVYEFSAEWKQGGTGGTGFWGNAGYIFMTE